MAARGSAAAGSAERELAITRIFDAPRELVTGASQTSRAQRASPEHRCPAASTADAAPNRDLLPRFRLCRLRRYHLCLQSAHAP